VLPLKDYNPTSRFPIITVLLIAVNVAVFFFIQRPQDPETGEDVKFTFRYAAIPCEVVEGRPLTEPEVVQTLDGEAEACDRRAPDDASQEVFPEKSVWIAILSSMFLHGGWLHLGGNMLFLWIFGNNIEDRMGVVPYIAFYLLSGLAAAAAHIAVQPDSTIPVVGASGAVAGVMGAYLVLFPNVKIRTLFLFLLVLIRDISAKWLLGFWFVLQFFTSPNEGVAWVAHVGGFIFGAVVALIFRAKLRPSKVDPVDPAPAF
jgi:membrane associated rhomboid family serine protease